METKLLPCPFCGGEAGLSAHDNHYVVECMNVWCEVGAYTELRYPQSAEQAVEAWNTRHERTCRIVDETGTTHPHKAGENEEFWGPAGECSECGALILIWSYCPNCGARVKEEYDV